MATLADTTLTGIPTPVIDRYVPTLGNLILNNIPSTNPNLVNNVKAGAWSPYIYNTQFNITSLVPLPTLA